MSHARVLQVDGLVKRFGGLLATDNACFDVLTGEVHALIGPNGAGKTTLIHLISGSLVPDAGRVHFDGIDVSHMPMPSRVAHGLARSYQITSVFPRLTVLDNVALAVQAHAGNSLNFWRPARRDHELYALAAEVVQRIGLSEQLQSSAAALSHGQQRQLEVGLALATRPKLLLLDEPLAGMGPEESERMIELLQSLRGETTLLLVEHDMDAVFRLAERISVLVYGRIIATGLPQDIRVNPLVRAAYLGDEQELGA